MKKSLVAALLLAILAGAAYLGLGFALGKAGHLAMTLVSAELEKKGFQVVRAEVGEAAPLMPRGARWRSLALEARSAKGGSSGAVKEIDVSVAELLAEVTGLAGPSVRVTARGVDVSVEGGVGAAGLSSFRLEGAEGRVDVRLASLSPGALKAKAGELLSEFNALVTSGRCALPVVFSGEAAFSVAGKPFSAGIRVLRDQDGSTLVMDETDIMAISQEFDLERPLTEAEVRLLSRHPLQAPRLFSLRSFASAEAKSAHARDSKVPEDAYRHVLWSFLLAKEFGAPFAEQVTDAHEEGRTGNTREERLMDLRNNEIGRGYAARGYEEKDLVRKIAYDAAVVLSPEEVSRKVK